MMSCTDLDTELEYHNHIQHRLKTLKASDDIFKISKNLKILKELIRREKIEKEEMNDDFSIPSDILEALEVPLVDGVGDLDG